MVKNKVESISKKYWDCFAGAQQYTSEEKSVFVDIDRLQENRDVDAFQKTGDQSLFEKVYNNRIPTLQIWARKNYYLMDSNDDMFGEFTLCFTKAVYTYKKSKGSFNTWLFYLLMNCVKNLQTGRKAKKRLPKGMEPNTMKNSMLSLDYAYNKDDENSSLKNIIANKMSDNNYSLSNIINNDTIKIMSNNNTLIRNFFEKISDGHTIASLIKEYKTKKGNIKINNKKYKSQRKYNKKDICDIIKQKLPLEAKFSLVKYNINENNLFYTIEMKKTKETDSMIKTIRHLRKNKEEIFKKIW